jgi:sigma-B regulation protein RsbU (phosphoserine phosphatase)
MTVVPISNQPSINQKTISQDYPSHHHTPVLALKELVANLQREQNKIQNLLSSLGFALRSFNNLNQFLELTPLMAARVTDAEGGTLILYKGKNRVSLEQIYCQNSELGQDIRKKLETVIHQINVDRGRKLRTPNVSLESERECFPVLLEDKIKAELAQKIQIFSTPILVKNVERGRLYVFSSDAQYLWTQTRRKLAQLVADQTAVAIANNELTVELRSKERQDRELEIASEIQLRLLPRKCPTIQGVELAAKCKTASRVGGDYYDFIPTNYEQLNRSSKQSFHTCGETWSIVIGDVMGKGVPAGLIMTMTRGMLRAEVPNRHSPAKILEHLNRAMYADLENSHRFVTLFYSEYDPQTKILSYTNAAHNPPLLWQAETKTIKFLDTQGMLVGLDPDAEYEDEQVQLSSGDTIIYYTDGFTDAVNQNGERFDEGNLRQAFEYACQHYSSSQEILDYIFTQVEKFIGFGHDNTDDMTLVIMLVKSD